MRLQPSWAWLRLYGIPNRACSNYLLPQRLPLNVPIMTAFVIFNNEFLNAWRKTMRLWVKIKYWPSVQNILSKTTIACIRHFQVGAVFLQGSSITSRCSGISPRSSPDHFWLTQPRTTNLIFILCTICSNSLIRY